LYQEALCSERLSAGVAQADEVAFVTVGGDPRGKNSIPVGAISIWEGYGFSHITRAYGERALAAEVRFTKSGQELRGALKRLPPRKLEE
jgi:hypothetical protein